MPPDAFLHERSDFKALVETVADSEKINDPALVEKDYWIMHAVFGLHRYVRPVLGEQILAALEPLDLQAMYQQMTERGLSARTIRYAHVLMKGAMQQAVRWRLLLEDQLRTRVRHPIRSRGNNN